MSNLTVEQIIKIAKETATAEPGRDGYILPASFAYAIEKAVMESLTAAPDGWRDVMQQLVREIERNTCMHEDTHRGGALWEICDRCGASWADDEGGKPQLKWPECVEKARAILAAPQPCVAIVEGKLCES